MHNGKWTYKGGSRRYHAWADYCREVYGGRVQKVAIDAGFTCPNRDGTLGTGGCTFCNNEGFNPSYCSSEKSISQQLDEGLLFLKRRYPRSSFFVAYFQAYSNTYAPLARLKELYEEALSHRDISGLVIATRPDCVDDARLSYLENLLHDYYIKIEYGIESCDDETLARIRRGHNFADAVHALEMTAGKGIPAGAHLLFGLPGESREQMFAQVDKINRLPLQSIKFHQLQIVKGTPMAEEYASFPERFGLFSLDDYLRFLVGFVERLRPDIAIERLSGEVPLPYHAGISWGRLRVDQVQKRFEDMLAEKDTWQGKLFVQT